MRIPQYWSRATAEGADRKNRQVAFSCWRSSDVGVDDARESALAAAQGALQRILGGDRTGRYPYGDAPLREEVIQRFTDEQGGLYAAVTRNGYGSLVLNAARALFIDLDFPIVSPWEGLKYSFAKLFNKSMQSPDSLREDDARRRLERFASEHPGWGIRIYRTFAGLRGLATHDLFDPASDATLAVLQSLRADPLYVRLCKSQECFRARLTPKPWRCGHYVNRTAWPRESEDAQRRFDEWLSTYMSRQAGYATCRYLGTVGSTTIHPEIATIIEVHDKITRCDESLDLA
jgi:hypothetical protein